MRRFFVKLAMGSFFLFSNSFAFAKIEVVLGNVAMKDNPNLIFNVDVGDESEIVLSRDQYVISYNKIRRNPNWVAWRLEEHDLGRIGRTNMFAQDTELERYLSQTGGGAHAVTSEEYHGSCFDRGHQLPSADRTQTLAENEATFIMSNIIPQTPYLNRVLWEHLEVYTRSLVRQGKIVYVVAGPIFDTDFGKIGPQADIQVPSKDFKIIIVLEPGQTLRDLNSKNQIISVVMPNTQENGQLISVTEQNCPVFVDANHSNPNDWQKYQVGISEIEKLSGVHFSVH